MKSLMSRSVREKIMLISERESLIALTQSMILTWQTQMSDFGSIQMSRKSLLILVLK